MGEAIPATWEVKGLPARTKWLGFLGLAALLAAAPEHAAQTRTRQANAREEFLKRLVAAAEDRTHHTVRYDPAYVRIPYPGGDVPADTGVCTDEVIRSYRAVGVDLQKEVHEDMVKNSSAYPRQRRWLISHPDTNIDHRRVPNLMVFFSRKGETLPISARADDYLPGDMVTWDLGGGVRHIGIVVSERSAEGGRHLIVHNIGQGPKREDVLFQWKITGHYRYFGPPGVSSSELSARYQFDFCYPQSPGTIDTTPLLPSIRHSKNSILTIPATESVIMAKLLDCNDLVPGGNFEARGICEEEVIVADHIATVHNMFEISDRALAMLSKAIHEEVRVRTRFARG